MQVAAGAPLRWNNLDASMMASTVLSAANPAGGLFCSLCHTVDHHWANCAVVQLEP